MIVCHCNVITLGEIVAVVDELIDADPWRVVTPGLVYMTLGKRGRCCGCFPNAVRVIEERVEARRAAGGRTVRDVRRPAAEDAPAAPLPRRRSA